jgi:hypothetical protein
MVWRTPRHSLEGTWCVEEQEKDKFEKTGSVCCGGVDADVCFVIAGHKAVQQGSGLGGVCAWE